VKVMSS